MNELPLAQLFGPAIGVIIAGLLFIGGSWLWWTISSRRLQRRKPPVAAPNLVSERGRVDCLPSSMAFEPTASMMPPDEPADDLTPEQQRASTTSRDATGSIKLPEPAPMPPRDKEGNTNG